MKSVVFLLLAAALFSACSSVGIHAPDRNVAAVRGQSSDGASFLDERDLRAINLTGFWIENGDGQKSFDWQVTALENPSDKLLGTLVTESNADVILSRIYVGHSLPTYKNIYAYVIQVIDQEHGNNYEFQLVTTFQNAKGHFSTIHYHLKKATQGEMEAEKGATGEIEKYLIKAPTSFFPIGA